jgi:hypothetical protein
VICLWVGTALEYGYCARAELGTTEMTDRKFATLFTALPFAYGLVTSDARADNAAALKEIADTADHLCGFISQSGSKSKTEIAGDVKAELSGLAKKLANLGVTGTGTFEESQYEGVLQEQLSDNLKDIRQCKLKIFDDLQAKLIVSSAAPSAARNPNAIYQYGESVGEVQGAVISQANGIVTFQTVHTSGKADPNRDVEYQNWVLRCPNLPAPAPGTTAGMFSGVIAGEKCAIIGKVP